MEATATARLTDKPAPAWTVTAARGVKKDIKPSDFKGKWLLLLFWSSAHVTFNNYDLTRLIDLCESRAKDRDKFEIILFHDNTIKDFEQLDAKLKKSKEMFWRGRDLPFPVLLDSTGQTFKEFGIRGLPTPFLIDPQGNVVGPAWQEELEAKLPELPVNVRVVNALDKLFTVYFDDPLLDEAVADAFQHCQDSNSTGQRKTCRRRNSREYENADQIGQCLGNSAKRPESRSRWNGIGIRAG